jgi:hypothetical protein
MSTMRALLIRALRGAAFGRGASRAAIILSFGLLIERGSIAFAAESPGIVAPEPPKHEAIKAAIAKSLPLLENGARVSLRERARCFTCHNEGLTVMALTAADGRGFPVDRENLRAQVAHAAGFLAKNAANYREGRGQGGQVDTAGYALWTLARANWKPDATTAAVAEYFLLFQKDLDHWKPASQRPPTEQSPFTSTHLALLALKNYGTPEKAGRIQQRFAQARAFLLNAPGQDTEDHVSRLRGLAVLGAKPEEIGNAVQALLHTQRADGGWAQLPGQESDAYATATALLALNEAGDLPVSDFTYTNGILFLLSAQLGDGSWHVKTRSKPIQEYYESGYPHGKDQFISIAAASWATMALLRALN